MDKKKYITHLKNEIFRLETAIFECETLLENTRNELAGIEEGYYDI